MYRGLDPLPPAFSLDIIVQDAHWPLTRATEIRELTMVFVERMLQV